MIEPTILERSCPTCGATIRHDRAFVPWCESCNWNVDVELRGRRAPSRLDRFRANLGRRLGESLYRDVLRHPATKPRLNLSALAVYLVSLAVLALAVLILVLGIRIIASGGGVFTFLFGLVLVLVAVVGRPRFAPLPERRVERADAPQLYRLLDAIADQLHAPHIHTVGIDHDWNASTYRAGLRGRVVVNLGLPLWLALEPAERVSLLGHELAHQVNGDVARGRLAGAALDTLAWWSYVIEPDDLMNGDPGFVGLAAIPFNLVLLGISRGFELVSRLLILLYYRDGQRAEFYADRLGVSVAGSRGAVAAFERMGHGPAYLSTVSALAIADRPAERLYDELVERIARTPSSEIERRHRAERLAGSPLDATHPPTYQRIGVIEAAPSVNGSIVLTSGWSGRIDEELAAHRDPLARMAVEEYLELLS